MKGPHLSDTSPSQLRSRAQARGGTLVYVLVLSTLMMLTAFVFAGSVSSHLNFVKRSERLTHARLLADSAISRAVAEIQVNSEFGLQGESLDVSLPGGQDGDLGRISFSATSVNHSTNNLTSDTSSPGWGGRLVPPYSAHLVGEGRCGDSIARVEAIVALPPYPYAIASSGPIESDGELLVGSLVEQVSGGAIAVESLLPAHLASNDPLPSSVSLGSGSLVMGDIRSAGGIDLSPGVVVRGETLAYGEPVAIPEVDLERYDPRLTQTGFQSLPGELAETTVTGSALSKGDLIILGGLHLDQAKLYVDGHLSVRGPISGRGVVVATRGADLRAGARLSGGHAVLLSGGDVSLRGAGPLGSFFQGLVYSQGEFQADNITVVGSFISQGESAKVKLRNARVLGDPAFQTLNPTGSATFYFVLGESTNEPAVQVPGPTSGSFPVEVQVRTTSRGPEITVVNPLDGSHAVTTSYHTAARQIAVVANQFARQLSEQGAVPGGGKNLVAVSESLERSLEVLAERAETPESTFDLNRFLGVSDRLRVTLWREL